MPVFFLYGQTIHPLELEIKGAYQIIIFPTLSLCVEKFFQYSIAGYQ